MNLPFCDICVIRNKCLPDFRYFKEATGNKRIPPETFCKKQYKKFNVKYNDFYKKLLIKECGNVSNLIYIYPELEEELKQLKEQGEIVPEPMPLSVTLMITEKCNLKCRYCYEVFSNNMKARTMSFETAKKAIDFYMTPEHLQKHKYIHWDIIGGELFIEFELLKQIVEYLIYKHRSLGLCPKKYLVLDFCTNGTMFTPEIKTYLEELKNRISYLTVGVSLDGPRDVHNLNRGNSYDKIMENFQWWRDTFPECTIKGTMNADTIGSMYNTIKFFVEELKLSTFFINPVFEGPWTDELAVIYSEELIKLAEYFLQRPEYKVLSNSNIFKNTDILGDENGVQNWCGSGVYMRAITPDGTIYPCLRAATSRLLPIGSLDTGIDKNKIIPFYFYTKYNEEVDCVDCGCNHLCPSCVMEWVEDTGDMYNKSKKFCIMARVNYLVSKFYKEHTTEIIDNHDERYVESIQGE